MVAVHPEYTIEDLRIAHLNDPFDLDSRNSVCFSQKAFALELEILSNIYKSHDKIEEVRDVSLRTLLSQIKDRNGIWTHSQMTKGYSAQLYEPPYVLQSTNLKALRQYPALAALDGSIIANVMYEKVATIHTRCNNIRVLHLQKVPLLDRRVLAIIVRACPQLRMLGVYDCPLIHYGDVLCLLDLIYDINKDRAGSSQEIEALDFAPHFEKGPPYRDGTSHATLGLIWNYEPLDEIQRGFYCILLVANLKYRAMVF